MANDYDIKFDLTELSSQFSYFKDLNKKLGSALDTLAAQAYQEAITLAQKKLRTNRDIYLQNLSFKTEGSSDNKVYVIVLNEKALWVEEGVKAHNLKETHLKGKKSVVIPFNNNKNTPSMSSDKQKQILSDVKDFIKSQKLSLNKPMGTQSMGGKVKPVRSFPTVPSKITNKKGQSVLNKMNVYQTSMPTKSGGTKTQSTVMTYRTLTSDSDGWDVPELKGAKILDQVYDWILQNYERILQERLPALILGGG